jgi:RNA polymerase sigma factor (sigma-70 family)
VSLEKRLEKAIASKNVQKIEIVFEEIYYEYGKLVGFIISKYVYNKSDIEELVDDVFVNFSKAMMKTKIENIKYYLVVQTKNICINYINRNNKLNIVYDDEIIFSQNNNDSKYYELINEMERILNKDEIQIVLLHTIYNYTFDEIANKLSKPLPTIASMYRRTIKKMKKE